MFYIELDIIIILSLVYLYIELGILLYWAWYIIILSLVYFIVCLVCFYIVLGWFLYLVHFVFQMS